MTKMPAATADVDKSRVATTVDDQVVTNPVRHDIATITMTSAMRFATVNEFPAAGPIAADRVCPGSGRGVAQLCVHDVLGP